MSAKPILVLKFGTASITNERQEPDVHFIEKIASQVAELSKTYNMVIVSSGAVAAGKPFLKNYHGTLSERKAAAAVGNPILLQLYSKYFNPQGIFLAQSLCERNHFSNRNQFLQLKKTYEELWKNGLIPIANENDVVSNLELKFSDNDELATLISVGFGASLLLLCTSVEGVLGTDGKLIRKIKNITADTLSLATRKKSATGLGGMTSKLNFARLATQMGIKTIIFGGDDEGLILKAVSGKVGTVCLPQQADINARKKWLASGSIVSGCLQLDAGAAAALVNRKSLLAVGVSSITRPFVAGEVIELLAAKGECIALAKAKIGSAELAENLTKKNYAVAHANDIVVL